MSIYASIPGISDDDDEIIGAPWLYQGSHILPAGDHPRGGSIGLAMIPSHITRDGRDDAPEDAAPWPWLRLHITPAGDDPCVVINPAQARHLAEVLAAWADQAEPRDRTGRHTVDTITSDALDALYEQLEATEETEAQQQLAAADELCDVIVTAAVALASIVGNPQYVLGNKLAKIANRAGVN